MELKWLLDFISLSNTGNFSRSAAERNVTQSAFSRRIQALENWLGTELVDRTSHPVSLTDSGIRFLKPARNMIRLAQRFKEDFSDNQPADRESLTFASSTNLAIEFLPSWLTAIGETFEPFDIKVQTDISGIHDHFEALRNQQCDFLLHYGHGVSILAMDASRFEHLVVGTDTLVPAAIPALAERLGARFPGSDEQSIPYISPWRTSPIAKLIADNMAEFHPSARLRTVVESSIVGCTRGFVDAGVGMAWLPKSGIRRELAGGELIQLGDDKFEIPLSIELYRYGSNSRPLARRFWNHLKTNTD